MTTWLNPQALPLGLRQFAAEEGLTDEQVQKVARAYDTIRGGRPRTMEEWRIFWNAVKPYFQEDA